MCQVLEPKINVVSKQKVVYGQERLESYQKGKESVSVEYNVMKIYTRKREVEKDKIKDIYLQPYQGKIYKLQQL